MRVNGSCSNSHVPDNGFMRESFVRGGPPLNFDLVDERRRENLNNTKIGPPLAHQRNVI